MLSRKYLKFIAKNDGVLPYDNNYILSVILYKKMSLFNKEFSEFLHDTGYISKDAKAKKMKMFNYSLIFYNLDMLSNGIKIKKGDVIQLAITGYKEPLNAMIHGFLMNNTLKINESIFEMTKIEDDKNVRFNKINIYKPLNLIIESIWNDKVEFLTPYQLEYYNAIKQNLIRKYEIIYNKPYDGELKIMIENVLDVKPKTIKIKQGYLQGYGKFNILVQADRNMQKVAYYCGLGQNNSMGAGYVEYITGGE